MPQEVADCPLDWVNVMWSNESYSKITGDKVLEKLYPAKYRVHNSFFWNVMYKSISQHYHFSPDSGDWTKKVVWSNLYKITPDKANPSNALQLAQMPGSAMLIKRELEEIQPRFCLALTGEPWWAPFRKYLGSEVRQKFETSDQLVSLEQFGTTRIIVTDRPHSGDSTKFAKRINEYLEKKCLKEVQLTVYRITGVRI